MKRALVVVAALMVVCGSGYALNYTYIGGASGAWTTVTNWDNGSGGSITYPHFASDTVLVNTANSPTLPTSLDVGQITFTGSGSCVLGTGAYSLTCDNSAGQSGNWWKNTTGYSAGSGVTALTYNVYGNFYDASSYISGYYTSAPGLVIQMRGNNKAIFMHNTGGDGYTYQIQIYGSNVWENGSGNPATTACTLTVEHGATIGATQNANSAVWNARRYVFVDGQSNLPAVGSAADFAYDCLQTDNNTFTLNSLSSSLLVTGGVTYPRDVFIEDYASGNRTYQWKLKGGNLVVGRDLIMARYIPGDAAGYYYLSTLENGTKTSDNITVNRDFYVNRQQYYTDQYSLAKLNNSTVKVGRDLSVGYNATNGVGSLDMGNATIYVGRNFKVFIPQAWTVQNWKSGLSTVICNGNGTAYHQNQVLGLYGDCGITLNNLQINNPGGAVWLDNSAVRAGSLRMTGNFEIDCGSFKGWKNNIAFTSGSHTITNYVNPGTYKFDDNVNLLAGSVVTLGSSITLNSSGAATDNLVLGAGSSLYLNGFTFSANGKTWVSSLVSASGVGYEQGTIFGTLSVPEPATLLLLGSGALGALGWMRRRRVK